MQAKFPSLTAQTLIDAYIDPNNLKYKKPPVLIMGAGCSMPSLPSAIALKREIADNLIRISGNQANKEKIYNILEKRYFTLEVFGSVLKYHAGDKFDPVSFWESLNNNAKINPTSKYIATLIKKKLIGPIITINFDSFIYDCLNGNLDVITEGNFNDYGSLPKNLPENSFIAIHGTVIKGTTLTDPSSVISRGFTKPLNPKLYDLIKKMLLDDTRAILFAGISGNDHYDLNQLLMEIKDSGIKERSAWFSYRGDGSDLDIFVKNNYRESIFDCKACDLFKVVCDLLTHKNIKVKPKHNCIDWKKVVKSKLQNFTQEMARNILLALQNNTVAAWVTMEHYLLYSIGYPIRLASNMLGDDAEYYEIDLSEYINAYEYYWKDKDYYKNFEESSELEKPHFDCSRNLFKLILSKCKSSLNKCSNKTDKAMIHVIMASCYDYLGLMDLQHVLKLESRGNTLVENYRKSALGSFGQCEKHSVLAKNILESSTTIQNDFIPYEIWKTIAQENSARILPMNVRSKAIKKVAQNRENIIEKEKNDSTNNYLLAHYPQCLLRWTEYAKALLQSSGDDDIPISISDKNLIDEIKLALDKARVNLESFEEISSQINHRKAVLVDANICLNLALGKINEAINLADKFEESLATSDANKNAFTILASSKERINKMKAKLN